MEENNLIELELLESDEVNVPSETVTSNVVPQDNSQQSEKTGEIVKNKGNLIILILVEDSNAREKLESSFDNL